jgi:hypothetical protein
MLKGSVLFFTYLITLFYLKRALSFKKHLYMLVILVALGVIGSANLAESSSKCRFGLIQLNHGRYLGMGSSSFRSFYSA